MDDDEAHVATTTRYSRDDILKQKMCWHCRGMDHTSLDCPSPGGFRAVGHVIHVLQGLSETAPRKGASRAVSRKKGMVQAKERTHIVAEQLAAEKAHLLSISKMTKPGD